MKRALALAALALAALPLAALALTALASPSSAQRLWPAIPPELGPNAPLSRGWIPYRCSERPVLNFYDGALYDQPPAVYRGYVYRPYYRYTAARVVPRVYFCVE